MFSKNYNFHYLTLSLHLDCQFPNSLLLMCDEEAGFCVPGFWLRLFLFILKKFPLKAVQASVICK